MFNGKKVKCNKCGYEKLISGNDSTTECPICGAQKAFNQRDVLSESELLEHIQEGMRVFGIEGLIETIENPDITPLNMRIHITKVIQKYYPKLHIRQVTEGDFKNEM